jgi:hypothetical protein
MLPPAVRIEYHEELRTVLVVGPVRAVQLLLGELAIVGAEPPTWSMNVATQTSPTVNGVDPVMQVVPVALPAQDAVPVTLAELLVDTEPALTVGVVMMLSASARIQP